MDFLCTLSEENIRFIDGQAFEVAKAFANSFSRRLRRPEYEIGLLCSAHKGKRWICTIDPAETSVIES